jgi:hypothetical protein
MSLTRHEQIKILEGIYTQLMAHFDQRQRVLDNLHSMQPGCGAIGQRGPSAFDGFVDVEHGASCVQQMKVNIEDVDQRIALLRNPPIPEQRMTDQQLFDRAIGDAQKYGVDIVKLVQGLHK